MNRHPRARGRRAAFALTATGGLLAAVGLAGLGPVGAQASSHREAPLISGMPQYDTTDLYAFRSPDRQNTVTLIANWIPFEEPAGGPNFYSFANDARYDIKIDNDGDTKADVIYRWTFKDHYRSGNTFLYATGPVTSLNDENLNFYQTYRLTRITGRAQHGARQVGARSFRPTSARPRCPTTAHLRTRASTTIIDGRGSSFAGQAEDPFFLDLRVFDLLYGGDFSEAGDDTLAGFNVNSVALQVPRVMLSKNKNTTKNPIVGIWTTTDRRGVDGKYHQVSRLGMPLVNEVVIPVKDKDKFNASQPSNDTQFLDYVTKPELPKLIEAVYGIPAPDEPRNDLVSVFLTGVDGLNQPEGVTPSEQLRLNLTTPVTENPNRLGVIGGDVQGYPNGRRLADDVIDISLQVVEGELVGNPNDLSDGVDTNDQEFSETFPYLALPARGSDDAPHPGGGAEPSAGEEVRQRRRGLLARRARGAPASRPPRSAWGSLRSWRASSASAGVRGQASRPDHPLRSGPVPTSGPVRTLRFEENHDQVRRGRRDRPRALRLRRARARSRRQRSGRADPGRQHRAGRRARTGPDLRHHVTAGPPPAGARRRPRLGHAGTGLRRAGPRHGRLHLLRQGRRGRRAVVRGAAGRQRDRARLGSRGRRGAAPLR